SVKLITTLFPLTLRRPPRSTLFPYTTLFRSGRTETAARDDDLHADAIIGRLGERQRIGQLAPEVQPAHEGEDLADGRTCVRSQAPRQGRAGVLPQQKPGALASAVGGREQEDLVRWRHIFSQSYVGTGSQGTEAHERRTRADRRRGTRDRRLEPHQGALPEAQVHEARSRALLPRRGRGSAAWRGRPAQRAGALPQRHHR